MRELAVALKSIERQRGVLLPRDVVEAARDPSSPLHSHFDWDDSSAAEKFRLDQARSLIRTVKIDVTIHDVPMKVVAYVRDPDAGASDAGYRNIVSLRSEEDSARYAVIEEMKRVANAVQRARSIAAFLGVDSDLTQIESIAKGVTNRINPERPDGPVTHQ